MKKYEGEEECLEWEAVKCNNAQNQNTSPEWFKVIHQADLSTSVQHMQDRETDCMLTFTGYCCDFTLLCTAKTTLLK